MVFGYMNRNYDERPEIPIGPNNSFSPEPADRGQPTHFYPRRQQFMFRVRVPANFGKQQLVWTLTRAGKTEKAIGKLDLEWEISQGVISQNRRGLGNDAVTAKPNTPPTISPAGSAKLTARSASRSRSPSTPATMASRSRPSRTRRAAPAAVGAARRRLPRHDPPVVTHSAADHSAEPRGACGHLDAVAGPGRLTFAPPRTVVKEGKASTNVTFTEPGTYVIRAFADDGIVFEATDITVAVSGS